MQTQKAKKIWYGNILLVSSVVLFNVFSHGCLSSPSEDPDPPSGGQKYVLDYGVFVSTIDSLLTDHGCDNLACHGGGIRGTFQLSPVDDKDVDLDFAQVILQVNGNDPAASPLLTKPLAEAAGGAVHTDPTDAFASTNDPNYQTILSWIKAGEFQ
jgi:hypothetical protein